MYCVIWGGWVGVGIVMSQILVSKKYVGKMVIVNMGGGVFLVLCGFFMCLLDWCFKCFCLLSNELNNLYINCFFEQMMEGRQGQCEDLLVREKIFVIIGVVLNY